MLIFFQPPWEICELNEQTVSSGKTNTIHIVSLFLFILVQKKKTLKEIPTACCLKIVIPLKLRSSDTNLKCAFVCTLYRSPFLPVKYKKENLALLKSFSPMLSRNFEISYKKIVEGRNLTEQKLYFGVSCSCLILCRNGLWVHWDSL